MTDNRFTNEQLLIIGELMRTKQSRRKVCAWLLQNYNIRLEMWISNTAELLVPESITKEDAQVIFSEMRILFG